MKKLVVGLGNPGEEYVKTRHNLGFEVIDAFAKKHQIHLAKEKMFPGEFGKFTYKEEEVFLLKPLTYMNSSGSSIKKCVDFCAIPLSHLLVIADDIYLPWRTLRLRPQGTSGGHKGLLSIEGRLGTTRYSRLRIGVGQPQETELKEYVLERLSPEETLEFPQVIAEAVGLIELWLEDEEKAFTKEAKSLNT